MHALYSFLVRIAWFFLKLIASIKPKIKLFIDGRKNVFSDLSNSITSTDKVIWMHVASLGEYEQGLPILQKLKRLYPNHKLLLTFFSPSGYEVKKNSALADIVTYLPLDTSTNAKRFIKLVNPKMALFIKYEIWPNYLNTLKKNKVPTFLVSALFSKKQVYFKWYGSFMRKSLKAFDHFFVQDANSKKALNSIGFDNVTISGDTRFDRVSEIINQNNELDFMNAFKQNKFCVVVGSSWPEDEKIIADFINNSSEDIKFVIAPHNIKNEHLKRLTERLTKKTAYYSQRESKPLEHYAVLIIDTIGLLTKIYSYADIAYVGGGFKTGLHNTLEPAVFGIPIIIGPNYANFKEAEDLVDKRGILSIKNEVEFLMAINSLLINENLMKSTGKINSKYVLGNTGATDKFLDYIESRI